MDEAVTKSDFWQHAACSFLPPHTVVCVCVCVCVSGGGSGFNLQTVAVCVPALWACVRYLCHQLCFSELSSLPSSVSLASWTKRPTLHPMQITSPLHPMHITAQCLQRCSSLHHWRWRFTVDLVVMEAPIILAVFFFFQKSSSLPFFFLFPSLPLCLFKSVSCFCKLGCHM